jgi:O-antigen/teichoic acid export membrane protein
MLAMGVIGAIVGIILSPIIVVNFKIPSYLRHESLYVFYILSISMPVVVVSSGLVGVLTAYQRFDLINAIKIPLLIANFVMPVMVLPFSSNLIPMTLLLVIVRLILAIIQLKICYRIIPVMRTRIAFLVDKVKPLGKFGGWMTVSNIISPLMSYLDRFFIGAAISIAAVTYYATPYEMITKLSIIPGALVITLYPTFASIHLEDCNRAMRLLFTGMKYSFIALIIIICFAVCFSKEILSIWLGKEFSDRSSSVLQWLAIGVLVNGIAQLPYVLLQGVGRPDITAIIHLCELIIYLPVLWWMLSLHGIVGAAIAWTLRVFIDLMLLLLMVGKIIRGYNKNIIQYFIITVLSCIAIMVFGQFRPLSVRIGFFLTCCLVCTPIIYHNVKYQLLPRANFREIIRRFGKAES